MAEEEKVTMFRNCYHITPSGEKKPISKFTKDELLQAYTAILSDSEGGGVYEPVAEGIRSEWQHRRYRKAVLWEIDRRFKNLRRDKKKSSEKFKKSVDMAERCGILVIC